MRTAYEVILGPLITEKLSVLAENANVVAFKVARDANKIEIREAVEAIFDKVTVEGVRTVNYRGKPKRMGRFSGRRPAWKKAYVTLGDGQSIAEFS